MTKPKVLLISARSDMGGGPKQVAEILEHLKSKAELYVAAPNTGEFAPFFQENSSGFFPLPQQKFSLIEWIKLCRFARTQRIDIVHSHGFGAGLYARPLKPLGFKVIHTFHGLHFKKGMKDRLKTLIEYFLAFLTDLHIAVSASESKKGEKLGIASKIIPNGISEKTLSKKKQNLSWPPKVLGSLSRLDPHKNVSQMIKIFSKLKRQNPELKLLVAGEGEEEQNLKELVQHLYLSEDVEFLGWQETYSFFDGIDLLVSASQGEGLPYTILEAIGYGLPVWASDVDGHRDLLPQENLFSLSSPPDILPIKLTKIELSDEFKLEYAMNLISEIYAKT